MILYLYIRFFSSVLNDRCQGATSLNQGEIEIMIHRRLVEDDSRGVGEPLNETGNFSLWKVKFSHLATL